MNKIVLRANLSGQFYFPELIIATFIKGFFDRINLSLASFWKKEMTFAGIKIHYLQTET
jgi:hypothetical protein